MLIRKPPAWSLPVCNVSPSTDCQIQHSYLTRVTTTPAPAVALLATFGAASTYTLFLAARVSEADARSAIDAKNAALTSEAALEFLYFEFLREFLADISEDGLKC